MKRVALMCLLVAGCSRASTEPPKAQAVSREHRDSGKPKSAGSQPKNGRKEPGEGPPVSSSWEGLLVEGGVGRIQDALVAKGLLGSGQRTGTLDARTRAALRELQKTSSIPATGIPDQKTIAVLGLDDDAIFKPGSEHH